MNILLINHYAGSTEMGMEFRPYYLAREWRKMGYNVTIAAGDFSHLRQKNPCVKADCQEELIDGIHYLWFRTGSYQGNGVKRAITTFRFVGKLLRHARKIAATVKPDVVIASSTYPFDTYAARKIARITNACLIHEVHDMWPATPVELGGISRYNPYIVAMQLAENAAYRRSDYVVSLLSCAEGYMKTHGLRDGRFRCIRNGVVLADWENPAPLPAEHEELLTQLKKDRFTVGYFGGHAIVNALDTLLDAAKLLKNTDIHIVLVGDGLEKKRLEQRAVNEQISNITFLPSVPKKAVPSLVAHFDCTYLGTVDSPLYRFGICMNKIFDSMMAGKPMVCAVNTPDTLIADSGCGIMADPGNPESIAKAILSLRDTAPEELQKMGENGKKAATETYNYTTLARQFAELFPKK